MELSIIKIGNSKGLRLSKELLTRYNIKDKVEVILKKDHLVLKPINEPRNNWDQSFKRMHANNDDSLLIDDVFDQDVDAWL